MEILVRFGTHQDRKYVVGGASPHKFFNSELYDRLILNANMVEISASACGAIVTTTNKPFIIDPITHAFGHSPIYIQSKDGTIKRGISELAGRYGDLVIQAVTQGRAVISRDFKDPAKVADFCSKVIHFQRSRLREALAPDAKYLDEGDAVPEWLLAPYFLLTAGNMETWLDINCLLIGESAQTVGHGEELHGVILIERALLSQEDYLNTIIARYADQPVRGYLLWVSDLPETEISTWEGRNLQRLVSALAGIGKSVYAAYGGYFSLLLSKAGMSGICYGPGYGEARNAVPVGGGLPSAKYYLPPVHARLPHREVQLAISHKPVEEFYEQVCACPVCRSVMHGGPNEFSQFGLSERRSKLTPDGVYVEYEFPTERTKEICNFHFLHSKRVEAEIVELADVPVLLEQLDCARLEYEPYLGSAGVDHLSNWKNALAG